MWLSLISRKKIQNSYFEYFNIPFLFQVYIAHRCSSDLERYFAPTYTGDQLPRCAVHHCTHEIRDSPVRISKCINSLRPRQNRRHFADDIFKCFFLNENEWISLRISPKFVPKVRINNIPSLVQIMAWRRPGDKPLSRPMVVSLLTQICVTRPEWVKASNMHCWIIPLHLQIQ